MNLVKLAIIRKVNPRMINVISAATLGGRARDLNKLIGGDLSKLMEYVVDYHIDQDEEERVVGRHRVSPGSQTIRPCTFWIHKGGCRREDECEYLHLTRDFPGKK